MAVGEEEKPTAGTPTVVSGVATSSDGDEEASIGTPVVYVAVVDFSQPPGQLVIVIKLVLVYVIVEVDVEVVRLVLPVVT